MEKAKHFTDLLMWQKAHQLVLAVYKLTENFPKHELFGLTSQIRRSTVSIPANIAEGFRKKTKPDKAKFMNIAQGSLDETHYYLILANDLQYANTTVLQTQTEEVAKILNSYIHKLRSEE
jgi:four helix bundle protein